jgi:hypothetical protein
LIALGLKYYHRPSPTRFQISIFTGFIRATGGRNNAHFVSSTRLADSGE